MSYDQLSSADALRAAAENLTKNGFHVSVVENAAEAKTKVLSLVPEQSEVMTMTSVTLDSAGLTETLNEATKYKSVRTQLSQMTADAQRSRKNKLGAAPDYTVGSVHAVTEQGQVVIASNTGSQLPAYAYGSQTVIWVVGTQKIVKDLDDAMKRIYEYVLPLESQRAHEAYGVEGSNVSKLLIINKEVAPNRLHVILVKEKLGF